MSLGKAFGGDMAGGSIAGQDFGKFRKDSRRHFRVRVDLTARLMFEDRREVSCRVRDMSVGGAAIETPRQGDLRERIVAYVDDIGRIEGRIVRRFSSGFALTWEATPIRRDKLADRLTWIVNRAQLGAASDERRHDRREPTRVWSHLVLRDGTEVRCRILDVSLSGAAVDAAVRAPVGAPVFLGRMRGRIIRSGEGSIGIEFDQIQSPWALRDQFGTLAAAE